MSFSAPVVSHSFAVAGGSDATGTIEWSLLGPMTNGTSTLLPPASLSVSLSSGAFSQAITSNLDPGTEPAYPFNALWRVDIQVSGAQALSYVVVVPPVQIETNGSVVSGALTTVQLSSLTVVQYMIGQSITGTGIPSNTIITAGDLDTNTVTISKAATPGTDLTLTLGATIDLSYLLPTTSQPL